MKRNIQTGISPKYVEEWTVAYAIREILQNFVDSKAEFNCDGTVHYKRAEGIAEVKDDGPGIAMRHLALGISEKGPDSIGKYGEGLKLAMLVLVREGRFIEVKSQGKIIRPVIEFSEDYQIEVLSFEVTDMEARHAAKLKGTHIRFECTEEELIEGKSYFLEFKSTKVEWVEKDCISYPNGQASIYINGAKAAELDGAIFSYHVKGEEAHKYGNRDRTTISQEDVASIIKKRLTQTRSLKVIQVLITLLTQGTSNPPLELQSGVNAHNIRWDSDRVKLWKKAFTTMTGTNTLLAADNEDKNRQAEYRGHEILRLDYSWNYSLKQIGIAFVEEKMKAKKPKVKRYRRKDLMDRELTALEQAINLTKRHYMAPGSIEIVDNVNALTNSSEKANMQGCWSPSDQKIYLKRSILTGSLHTLVHVLLHETVHKKSGADDLTSEFEHALLNVAVDMMVSKV